MGLTAADLTGLGTEVRSEFDDIAGNCRNIACRMQTLASDRFDVHLDVREVQMGERRDTHFVNRLAADDYDGTTEGAILVDAALDQYCTENQYRDGVRVDFGPREWLPEVAIYLPGAEERHVWYYAPNDPCEGRDVFTGDCVEE
jgi:hypothetical protein